MSKQSQATSIYEMGIEIGHNRQAIIGEIIEHVGVSPAYASTLYNNARKALNKAQAPKTPAASTHAKPKSKSGVQSFTRSNLSDIQNDIDAALKAVADQYGITIDTGSVRFSENQFTTKITAKTGDGSEAALDNWNRYRIRHGFDSSDFGREFTSTSGDTFRICGYKPKGKKYPIIAERVTDGASYKFGIDTVRRALSK